MAPCAAGKVCTGCNGNAGKRTGKEDFLEVITEPTCPLEDTYKNSPAEEANKNIFQATRIVIKNVLQERFNMTGEKMWVMGWEEAGNRSKTSMGEKLLDPSQNALLPTFPYCLKTALYKILLLPLKNQILCLAPSHSLAPHSFFE